MRLGIGICHRSTGYPASYLDLAAAMAEMAQAGIGTALLDLESSDIAAQRNQIVEKALSLDCQALLFVDDDQLWRAKHVRRLLSHHLPVVGGVIMTRSFTKPHITSYMLEPKPDQPVWFRSILPDLLDATREPLPIDGIGMGFTLLDLACVRQLRAPWFKTQTQDDGSALGEDLYFCSQMKAAGFGVYVDPLVRIPHLLLGAMIPGRAGEAHLVNPQTAIEQADSFVPAEVSHVL